MTEPIFARVFAEQWPLLPPAMQMHYANRAFTADRVTVTGHLTIRLHPVMKLFAPVFGALGMLTPRGGDKVPCTVDFLSQPDGSAFIFDRWFQFPGGKRYQFRSKLVAKGPHDVIEYMRCGIGWHCGYSYEGDRVVLSHKGYVARLFGADIPLPGAGFITGRGEAFEIATGDDRFAMRMGLRHSLLGWLYSYEGEFVVTEMALG